MAKKFPTSLEDENERSPGHHPASQTPERPIPHPREDRLSPLPHQESPHQTPTMLRRNSVGYNGARPRSSSFRARRPSEDVRVRRRRVDSLNLETPYHFDYDPTTNRYPLEPEATYIEGQELYLHFFHEQVRNAGLAEDFCLEEDFNLSRYHAHGVHDSEVQAQPLTNSQRRQRTMSMNLQNFSDPMWRQTGSELRALADAFQASPGRVRVRQRAEQVDVTNLDMEKFCALLKGLFENGQITRERILVLFFFCSDVAILAIRRRASQLVAQLTQWSLHFIRNQICSWVQENGGWSRVLHSGLNVMQQTAVIGTCVAVFVCCMIYIRKNW